MATALAHIEAAADEAATTDLLDAAWHDARAQVIGLTGPPGVGKSTLIARLIEALRAEDRSVGVIAIDPSSRRSGGALLGDRVRLALDAEDPGVFVRSMAARGAFAVVVGAALAVDEGEAAYLPLGHKDDFGTRAAGQLDRDAASEVPVRRHQGGGAPRRLERCAHP